MGHDIYAIRTEDVKNNSPMFERNVSYLRRSAFCKDRGVIYKALGAEKHYGDVSGFATWEFFDKARLEIALDKLITHPDQRKFIENCLRHLDEKGKIAIAFY